jgi:hypothetical protein
MRSMQGRVHASDATHHRLDVTYGTSRLDRCISGVTMGAVKG